MNLEERLNRAEHEIKELRNLVVNAYQQLGAVLLCAQHALELDPRLRGAMQEAVTKFEAGMLTIAAPDEMIEGQLLALKDLLKGAPN